MASTTLPRAVPLLLATVAALSACRGRNQRPPAPAGSVILISLDTLRADRLNCYGYREHSVSPNIDALARDGVLFENQITTSPWTTPAHLSLLTSLHPSSHGVTSSFRDLRTRLSKGRAFLRLPEARETLAEILQARDYATAAFTAGATLDPKIGFAQGFSVYDTSMDKLGPESLRKIEGWIDRRSDRKLFLFWHTFEVHAPYLQTTYLPDVLPAEQARAVIEELAARAHRREAEKSGGYGLRKVLEKHQAFTRQVCDALYMGGVRSADHWVGELLKFLRERRLYDQALIVVTSDHGEELGQRSPQGIYDAHGHTMYEELVRVPLIVKLPGQRHAGKRVGSVSSAVDVAPTILDLLSIPAGREMQGRSLRPRWDAADVAGGVAYSEALGVEAEKKALREDRYKYVLSIPAATVTARGRGFIPSDAERELYDLRSDPEERTNLLKSPRAAELAGLAARLDQALRAQVAGHKGEAEKVELSPEAIERLKGLGYIQ